MEAGAFIAEFYRRQDLRFPPSTFDRPFSAIRSDPAVVQMTHAYRDVLPTEKSSRILDIGFGYGEFIAAGIVLGYENIQGADFGIESRKGILSWSPSVRQLHPIETDIGTFLAQFDQAFDFIHLSHVIEHLPKYSLFYHLDAIYGALKVGGTLFIRTPNMDGPRPTSSRYVTITHETGFTYTNLRAVLESCNFEEVVVVSLDRGPLSVRQHIVAMLRNGLISVNRFMHRMFGSHSRGGPFGEELVVAARRLNRPPMAPKIPTSVP